MKIRYKLISTCFFSLFTYFCLFMFASHAMAKSKFDKPGIVKATEVLPESLVSNENFSIREDVSWIGGLHQFTVDTEYGYFEIWGESMLRIQLREFLAWKSLQETSSMSAGAQAIGGKAVRSVESVFTAFTHPVSTITGIPQGIGRLFKKVGRGVGSVARTASGGEKEKTPGSLNIDEDGDENSATDLSDQLVGVNSAYRRWAEKLGVNPYTTNTALKEELARVAKTDAYVSGGASLLLPGLPAGLGVVSTVSKSVYNKDWRELVKENRESMLAMGVEPETIDELFEHEFMNLSLITLIVAVLREFDGVDNRSSVINQAVGLESSSEAVWYAESLLMMKWFHSNEAPLKIILSGTLVPVALTGDNRVIVFAAFDRSYWVEAAAEQAKEFTSLYAEYSEQREMWVADQASSRFVEGMGKLGWKVNSGSRSTVLAEIPWGIQDDGE
jgi:hypothetical protein